MALGVLRNALKPLTLGGFMEKLKVRILYRNYKGDVAYRTIIPKSIDFMSTSWHPEEQWILTAFDINKNADRGFAIIDIMEWEKIDKMDKE